MNLNDAESRELSLLRFALNECKVDVRAYHIGTLGDERSKHDQLCLLRADKGTWHVLYTERGLISQQSEHSALNEASRDFFGRMTQGKAHWAFRAAWEQSHK